MVSPALAMAPDGLDAAPDSEAVGADAAGGLAPMLAAEAGAAALAAPALAGNGGAAVPCPASDAKVMGFVRTGLCDSRVISTLVCFFACQ